MSVSPAPPEPTLDRLTMAPRRDEGAETRMFQRRFTRKGVHPYSEIQWEIRDARIDGPDGEPVFEQKDVEVPSFWSQSATNVVVSRYFRGHLGTPARETSVRQLIDRVVDTITRWGLEQGHLSDDEEAETFNQELKYILVHQMAAFNSPVWFNVGEEKDPQCSACFILSVDDSMDSILELARTEGLIFKWGSGAGSNLSSLRGSMEPLTGGGTASGPVSFMRGFDAFAGAIKSGGKTRRAAKMVILDADHPDIEDFIKIKAQEEAKAHALIDAGYDGSFNVPGGAYDTVSYQNANHSVRVTDEFMRAVIEDRDWELKAVRDGRVLKRVKARDLMHEMAEAAWFCGDPGIQYHTTINQWHTCPAAGPIVASNPCSEYMFINDSACNLASLNLVSFMDEDGAFRVDDFSHAVSLLITAMDIIVDEASYPTDAIARNSHLFRTLGLGYANLGALLMSRGLAYDSDEGRAMAATLTALMHGEALRASVALAERLGPFERYPENAAHYRRVIDQHAAALARIDRSLVSRELMGRVDETWAGLYADLERVGGIRNAQVTLLAPTGTIGFMMDCDTTGIEPEMSLIRYKTLVGGGVMKLVNNIVPQALRNLGYTQAQIDELTSHLEEHGHLEDADILRPEHLPVFDCAFTPAGGKRSIAPMGHLRMMAAVQPFLSGAISKTVNVPHDTTAEEIERIFIDGWEMGLKAVAIYRDGCKRTQPLSTSPLEADQPEPEVKVVYKSTRRPLPAERASITHKFSVAGHDGYLTVGMYPDGRPGEIFVVMAKQGSTIGGLMDAFATAISIALQYGVPLEDLIKKFSGLRFEPSGYTGNPDIPFAKSIIDYVFRWMALKFASSEEEVAQQELPLEIQDDDDGEAQVAESSSEPSSGAEAMLSTIVPQSDAPICPECGFVTVRNGSCYKCVNCGASLGCS